MFTLLLESLYYYLSKYYYPRTYNKLSLLDLFFIWKMKLSTLKNPSTLPTYRWNYSTRTPTFACIGLGNSQSKSEEKKRSNTMFCVFILLNYLFSKINHINLERYFIKNMVSQLIYDIVNKIYENKDDLLIFWSKY